MQEQVYDYLREYGFTKEEVNNIEEINEKMFFTSKEIVFSNIKFLTDKGLSKEEIIKLINNNPFMLTVGKNRLEYLDKIYLNILSLNNDELKNLIISNSDTYIVSPIELEGIINYLKNNNYTNEGIKQLIINNPSIVSIKLDKFKELFNK